MRPATLAELTGEHGEQPPGSGGFTSFEDFMSMDQVAARLVREGPRENLLRLVREVVEDAAADGAVWIEPHVNPLTYEDDPGAAWSRVPNSRARLNGGWKVVETVAIRPIREVTWLRADTKTSGSCEPIAPGRRS